MHLFAGFDAQSALKKTVKRRCAYILMMNADMHVDPWRRTVLAHRAVLALAALALLSPPASAPDATVPTAAASVREWRARRGLPPGDAPAEPGAGAPAVPPPWGGCCPVPGPGRWCCPDGARCCPPRGLPAQPPPPPLPMPLFNATCEARRPRGDDFALIVEEAVSGLLASCQELQIPQHASDAIIVPAGSNLREAAEHVCRGSRLRAGGRAAGGYSAGDDDGDDESGCTRNFTAAAVEEALAGSGGAGFERRALYFSGRREADAACTRVRNGVRSDVDTAASLEKVAVQSRATLGFRWLESAGRSAPHLFVPRHPRGQVLVSDEYRFIFVHVPKAASTTVRALLWDRGGVDNLVYSKQTAYKRATYLTFAFVRDPLKRFVSAYDEVCIKLGPTCAFYDTSSPQGLRSFLAYTQQHPCWDEHVCDQLSFLRREDGRLMRLDVLAATDHIEPTMLHISSMLGFDPPLSREGLAPRNKGSLGASLAVLAASTPDIVRGVCALYADDYAGLGFPLPDACRTESSAKAPQDPPLAPTTAAADGNSAQAGGARHQAVFPREWVDSDLGLAALTGEGDVPTRALIAALTHQLTNSSACAACFSKVLHAVAEAAAAAHPTSPEAEAATPDAREARAHEGEPQPRAQEASGLEGGAAAVRGLILSTFLRLQLGEPLILPCCADVGDLKAPPAAAAGEQPTSASRDEGFWAMCAVMGAAATCPERVTPAPQRPCDGEAAAWHRGRGRERNRALDRAVGAMELSRAHGAQWARAVTAHWLWRPHSAHLDAALATLAALPHGARILNGEHLALVLASCPGSAPFDEYPHAVGDPCALEEDWRDGRLDVAPANGCYSSEAAARCRRL